MTPTDTSGNRTTRKEMTLWGVGSIGETIMQQSVGALVMPIFTTAFGMSAVLVSWAITIPRLLDAFADPIIGLMSDNARTRWGRRRPFLLLGAILCGILVAAVWWVPQGWPEAWKFTALLIGLIVFWLAFTLYQIPLLALGYELTEDYHQRTDVMAMRSLFCALPTFFLGWTYWLALRPVFGGEIHGIRMVSLVLGLLVFISGAIPVVFCRERYQTTSQPQLGLVAALKATLKNRYFLHLMGIQSCVNIGMGIFNAVFFYVNVYYICGGNKSLATQITAVGGTLFSITMFAGIPATPFFSRRLGKKNSMVFGFVLLLGNALLSYFLQDPARPYLQLIGTALAGISVLFATLFINAFIADICDLDEDQVGQRREGMFTAVMGFINKVQVSIASVIAGYLVEHVSNFNASLATQSTDTLRRLQLSAIVPYILCYGVGLAAAWLFPINQKMMDAVQARLHLARANRKQA
ncbi:MAG: MFS transporter [Opitutaceae bacterium]|nr:MFS transporter [Opitutaceae bacterium]